MWTKSWGATTPNTHTSVRKTSHAAHHGIKRVIPAPITVRRAMLSKSTTVNERAEGYAGRNVPEYEVDYVERYLVPSNRVPETSTTLRRIAAV